MRPKVHTPDALVAEIAARQHGVVTIEQLLRCGLTRPGVKRRVAAGRLFPIHRGVYAVGHGRLTDRGRWKAATLAIPNSVLSHRSAAELWRLLHPNGGEPHITVPYPASPTPRYSMTIHRSRTLARTTSKDGIPVTRPARTLGDLTRAATPAEVRRATRDAEARGLPLGNDRVATATRSDLEDDFLALCRRHRVPLPENNVLIGPFEVDFLWRPERLIAEADGYLYHRGRQAFREDREPDVELEIMGFRVVRFDDHRIAEDPAGIVRDVLALLAKAAP